MGVGKVFHAFGTQVLRFHNTLYTLSLGASTGAPRIWHTNDAET